MQLNPPSPPPWCSPFTVIAMRLMLTTAGKMIRVRCLSVIFLRRSAHQSDDAARDRSKTRAGELKGDFHLEPSLPEAAVVLLSVWVQKKKKKKNVGHLIPPPASLLERLFSNFGGVLSPPVFRPRRCESAGRPKPKGNILFPHINGAAFTAHTDSPPDDMTEP